MIIQRSWWKWMTFRCKTFKKQHIYPLGKAAMKYNIPRSTDFLKFTEMSGVNHENNSLTNWRISLRSQFRCATGIALSAVKNGSQVYSKPFSK